MEIINNDENKECKQLTSDNCNYSANVIKILNSALRVFDQLGPGHNERIYHKALVYELNCLGYNLDTEMNIIVKYKDSKGNIHSLETERIDIFIHEVSKEYLIKEEKIIIGGFSQGCMVALQTGIMRKKSVKLVIGYSGKIIDEKMLSKNINSKPMISLFHGDNDKIVSSK